MVAFIEMEVCGIMGPNLSEDELKQRMKEHLVGVSNKSVGMPSKGLWVCDFTVSSM